MEKVTGIGGVFIKAKDSPGLAAWYRDHLGIESQEGAAEFHWLEKSPPHQSARTVWSLFPKDSDYFGNPAQQCMINYRVSNLAKMLDQFKANGVAVHKFEEYDYGRFAWVTDPDGNKIELWEPKGE